MRKCQAGLEVLVIMTIIIFFSVIINRVAYINQFNLNQINSYDEARIACEKVSMEISKASQSRDFESNFQVFYNMTFDSDAGNLIVYYKNGIVVCPLIDVVISNSTSIFFNVGAGGFITIYNDNNNIRVSSA